jgi:pilus assembly protein CpaF
VITDEIKERIHRYLINETEFLQVKDSMNEDQLRNFVDDAIRQACNDRNFRLTLEDRQVLIRELVNAVLNLGPLRPLMEDHAISEIMVNGARKIYIQRHGQIILSEAKFDDDRHLFHTIQKVLAGSGSNKRVDESSPYVDFVMPDGSRVNVILPPCSLAGPVMTIRKFNKDIATVEDLLNLQMIDKNIATLLILAMKAKLNVMFCGSTGSGKTTMLNVFSRHIPSHERIITIEDTPELRLLQEHVVSLVAKPANIEGKGEITMRDLFVNSLRMRPDRIIIGEVRGVEMLDLIQSISSGHSGSLAIVHAETPTDAFNRMVTMMLMTGIHLSTEEIRRQVARAVDLIVHVELFMDGKRRVTAVSDVRFDESDERVKFHDIFTYNYKATGDDGIFIGEYVMDRRRPSFMKKFEKKRVTVPEGFFEKT